MRRRRMRERTESMQTSSCRPVIPGGKREAYCFGDLRFCS